MANDESSQTDRRTFLQAGALATVGALGTSSAINAQDAALKPTELPRRPLGKTGIDITILDQGNGKGPDVDRLLRFGFARGVRAYDTSETYHSEGGFKKWSAGLDRPQADLPRHQGLAQDPCPAPGNARQAVRSVGTDYVDLFFIHSYGDNHTLDDAMNMVKSKELKEAVNAAKKSGKARLLGISTHHKDRTS